ncbi:hypothetical protein B7486_17150 [cyanobacterium TDX16]|nr:hypothetical protein B7486_17150 [cyanobacterium TDX16]
MNRACAIFIILAGLSCSSPKPPEPVGAESTSPFEALVEGNKRFRSGEMRHPHEDAARRHDTALDGQHPFATIVGCADSRVPVEIILDQGLGDLFVIRVAGNVVATDEAGSIEYGVEHLKTPLLVVLGHEGCGAVTAVVDGAHVGGSIPKLVAHISPSVEAARRIFPNVEHDALVSAAVEQNVWHSIEDLIAHSRIVRDAVIAGDLSVQGAVYDLKTGCVFWLGAHPRQAELLTSSDDAWSGPDGASTGAAE